jgi:5'-deoxynucleotidase YfbR-like HD superfamily hydrolase
MTDEFQGGVPMTAEGLVAAHPNAIWTCSDNMVEPLDMKPEMVRIEDVAYALSNQPRFTGHVKRTDGFPFTVAQHSCNVARLVMRRSQSWDDVLYGLVHDGTEAFLSDMARPLKHYNEFGDLYREVEEGLMRPLAQSLGLGSLMPKVVKWADDVALRVECRDFMGPTMKSMYADGNEDVALYFPEPVEAWSHVRAEDEFMVLFHGIQSLRGARGEAFGPLPGSAASAQRFGNPDGSRAGRVSV